MMLCLQRDMCYLSARLVSRLLIDRSLPYSGSKYVLCDPGDRQYHDRIIFVLPRLSVSQDVSQDSSEVFAISDQLGPT